MPSHDRGEWRSTRRVQVDRVSAPLATRRRGPEITESYHGQAIRHLATRKPPHSLGWHPVTLFISVVVTSNLYV
jgi:hypothetical protein